MKDKKELQNRFLKLAVVKRLKYDSISEELGIDRKVFSPWWDELKEEREYLSMIRDRWLAKCPELDFDEFKGWFENTDKMCYYCEVTEDDLSKLWQNFPDLTKRNRGRKLEIERLEPNLPYNITSNLVFSCYWCNNAKTDTFTKDEFLKVGKVIENIWKERLI